MICLMLTLESITPVIGIFADERLDLIEDLIEQFQLAVLAPDRFQIIDAFRFEFTLQVLDFAVQRTQLKKKKKKKKNFKLVK